MASDLEWTAAFRRKSEDDQCALLEALLSRASLSVLTHVQDLMPSLFQKDFVSELERVEPDLADKILSYLDIPSLGSAARACKSWRRICGRTELWMSMCRARWPAFLNTRDANTDWRELYSVHHVADREWRTGEFRARPLSDAADRRCLYFDPVYAVAGGYKQVTVTSIESGERVATWGTDSGSWVFSIACNPAANQMATGGWDCVVRLYKLSDGSFVGALEGHGGGVWDLASTSDGGRLYSASNDMSLREWDVATGECTAVLEDHTAGVYTASLNGNLLVSGGGDSAVKVWDVRTQTCERTLSHHSMVVSAVQYDGVKLISASLDTTICSWDIGSGRVVRTYEGHTDAVRCLQFDDNKLVSGGDDNVIIVHDVVTGDHEHVLRDRAHAKGIKCLAYDTNRIISAGRDRHLVVWSLAGGSRASGTML